VLHCVAAVHTVNCFRPLHTLCCREELASLNRSIQSTAKAIKTQLEGLSRERAALPEPQQAKLRKLMQDFAAALQVCGLCRQPAASQRTLTSSWL
jgi:hypothetical protein